MGESWGAVTFLPLGSDRGEADFVGGAISAFSAQLLGETQEAATYLCLVTSSLVLLGSEGASQHLSLHPWIPALQGKATDSGEHGPAEVDIIALQKEFFMSLLHEPWGWIPCSSTKSGG